MSRDRELMMYGWGPPDVVDPTPADIAAWLHAHPEHALEVREEGLLREAGWSLA